MEGEKRWLCDKLWASNVENHVCSRELQSSSSSLMGALYTPNEVVDGGRSHVQGEEFCMAEGFGFNSRARQRRNLNWWKELAGIFQPN